MSRCKRCDGELEAVVYLVCDCNIIEGTNRDAIRLPEVRALVEYIRDFEWAGDRNEAFCLACGMLKRDGHAPDCEYIAILAPFET